MKVEEFFPLNHEARCGLWNFICQHDSMIDDLEMVTHEQDPLFYSLTNPNVKTECKPYFMARIVDVKKLLAVYPFRWDDDEPMKWHIEDKFAPWNTGTFTISQNEEPSYIEKHDKESGLSMSINGLTALLLGYKSARELYDIEEIQGSEEDVMRLGEIIPKNKPYFSDFF